ncbi:MAG TPA: hypothetical protein VN948_16050 [Terriglobales bacterium]|nr:hypothetical protein [Terriglobales bacterium]
MTNENHTSGLTPELIKVALQLEQIFMPQAKRQRDEAYKRQSTPGDAMVQELRFVHYTSAEAALKIIRSKRLWMRNATCMSDYREVQHGFDILNKFFSDKVKTELFVNALDACVPGAAQDAIKFVQQLVEGHSIQHVHHFSFGARHLGRFARPAVYVARLWYEHGSRCRRL